MDYWSIVLFNFMGLIRVFFVLGTIISAVVFANWVFELGNSKKDKKKILRNVTIWGALVVILPILMCFVPF